MRNVVFLILACLVSCGFAQGQELLPSRPIVLGTPVSLSESQVRQLSRYLAAMEKWKKYDERWFNRYPINSEGRWFARKDRPESPPWLEAICAEENRLQISSEELKLGCRYLSGDALYNQLDAKAQEIAAQTQAARADHEKVSRGSFFSRVHFDTLGTQPQYGNGEHIYVLFGGHVSLVDVGRLQFYGPPGVLLVSVPSMDGKHQTMVAYSWGMSYRLGDFRIPGSGAKRKNATAFINLTKVWLPHSVGFAATSGVDVVSFSISPAKK